MAKHEELTVSQATDLARFHLGPQARAVLVGMGTYRIIAPAPQGAVFGSVFDGGNWREAFRAAGIKLPSRSRYTQQGKTVMLNGEHVASCVSGSKASLICKALNEYLTPAALQ